jgi:uncharacterized protein YndB with AHSA1/START domain
MNTKPIVLEHAYPASAGRVWQSITDPALMRQWFFEQIESFRAEAGFYTEFDLFHNGRHFLHQWKVTEAVPERLLVCRWTFQGYPGDSSVAWELIPEGESTRLRLTVTGQETYPQDIPEFTQESCIQGWTYLLGENLRNFLEP